MKANYDVIVIGGGVVGSATARELSRYDLRVAVLEKELDVCNGVSGHNTGLLHSGVLNDPDTLRMECCLEGNAEFDQVAKELDVPFRRCGKLVVGFSEEERQRLEKIYQQGLSVGIPGLEMIDEKRIGELEPHAHGNFALYVPSAGILDPFAYTIALAENAVENGAVYYFDQEVTGVAREDGLYQITTVNGTFTSRWVINCAGLYSFRISEMLGFPGYQPKRVKGQYEILDKKTGKYLGMPIYPAPNEYGASDVHVTPTIDGNVLVGPTIEQIGDGIDYSVTQEMLDVLSQQGGRIFDFVKRDYYIRNYAGVFPTILDPGTGKDLDYVIETKASAPNAVNTVGLNSPGITSALPIARRIIAKMQETEALTKKENFDPVHRGIVRFAEQDKETQEAMIRSDPDYGEIFCRCECVTRAEIKQAIHNVLGVSTVSGIKYRTRATMGRCQGGYCETRITAAIQEELGKRKEEVLLNQKGAYMFTGDVK